MSILAFGLLAFGTSAQQAPANAPVKSPVTALTPATGSVLKTQKEKLSYAIGTEMGKGVKAEGLDVDPDILIQGLKDTLTDAQSLMTDQEVHTIIAGLQEQMRQKQKQELAVLAAENQKKGDEFLAENAKKPGVVSLPSGLQYKVITAGQGKKPQETDTVLCNYKGTFLNGTVFDSSERVGKPVPFQVNNVIPGFKEALQLMPVGSKWQIFVPSKLAYGENGAGNVIAPNETLIFEVELVSIQDKP